MLAHCHPKAPAWHDRFGDVDAVLPTKFMLAILFSIHTFDGGGADLAGLRFRLANRKNFGFADGLLALSFTPICGTVLCRLPSVNSLMLSNV
jgi:hypothetical protein